MTFDDALKFVLEREGGFVDNPADHGGATNKGITQSTYDVYRTQFMGSTRSVGEITDEEVADIYKRYYWDLGHCDELPDPLPLVQFDACVNCGVHQAMKFLQDAIGAEIDGAWGPETVDKLKDSGPRITSILAIGIRAEFYIGLAQKDPSQEEFVKGWMKRLFELRKTLGLDGVQDLKENP